MTPLPAPPALPFPKCGHKYCAPQFCRFLPKEPK